MTRPNSQLAGAVAKDRSVSAACRPGALSVLLLSLWNPPGRKTIFSWGYSLSRAGVVGSARGWFHWAIKISKCLFRLDHLGPTPSCGPAENRNCTSFEISANE